MQGQTQINHPDYYQKGKIEVADLTDDMNFNLGNVVKYVARAGKKPNTDYLDDLGKAEWYLHREIKKALTELASASSSK